MNRGIKKITYTFERSTVVLLTSSVDSYDDLLTKGINIRRCSMHFVPNVDSNIVGR